MSDRDCDGIPDWADSKPDQAARNFSERMMQDQRAWVPEKPRGPSQPQKTEKGKCIQCGRVLEGKEFVLGIVAGRENVCNECLQRE